MQKQEADRIVEFIDNQNWLGDIGQNVADLKNFILYDLAEEEYDDYFQMIYDHRVPLIKIPNNEPE